jgi:hypothetical protein
MAKKRSEKKKGDFLEDVAALLHQMPGANVETRVDVPVVDNPNETREIDILLSGPGLGYELRRAIECKNWKGRVGVGPVEEFLGKLRDIGIPAPLCAFVSVNGYTKGAIRRGAKEGLMLFTVSGIEKDRLSPVTEAAFQYVVYLVPNVELVNLLDDRSGESSVIKSLRYFDAKASRNHYALDNLWKKWLAGEIPRTLGLHHSMFEIPQDPILFENGEEPQPKHVYFGVRVFAIVVKIGGTATDYQLKNVQTGKVQKRHVRSKFEELPREVRSFETDEEVRNYLASEEALSKLVLSGVPLPRLMYFQTYWPPTLESLMRSKKQYESGEKPTFESVEGLNLSKAWSFAIDEDLLNEIPDDIPFEMYPSVV